jgi:glycosyltransferase involved in cell wall biosynthesis
MHILELNFERSWRGGERQTLYNMEGFRNAGVPVSLLCRKGYPLEERARAKGFHVISYSNIGGVVSYLAAHGGEYDVLHAQTSHILTWALATKPFHRTKVVFTRRVDLIPHGAMTRAKYRAADSITGISYAVKRTVEQFCGRDVTVIPDIIEPISPDKDRAAQMVEKRTSVSGRHIIGTIAMMSEDKDPLTTVEAIRLLAATRNDFIFLHFGTGPLEATVQAKVREYGLQECYLMMGFDEQVQDYFSLFDVFTLTSVNEGMGSSVLDAFLYHVPVVTTDAGGLAELVGEGRGICCAKGDAAALAEGMNRMMDEPEVARTCADRAYDHVVQHHGSRHITEQYLDVMRKL